MASPSKRVLVTGGAGFIGSHTVDRLVEQGWDVSVLDCLDTQVHGNAEGPPQYLIPHIEARRIRFTRGDMRDRKVLEPLIEDVEAILHLAAAVGIGQSMYMPHHYVDVNVGGTGLLLDLLANRPHKVGKIVLASSMSLYGEGAYRCPSCGLVFPGDRAASDLAAGRFEPVCPTCQGEIQPAGTPETKPLAATSIYALSKKMQEEMVLCFGKAYRIPVVALRYFNVYGPRQSLSNPYTGVAAIFISRLLNGHRPMVFEDGGQSRDFIHVRDVARANVLALEKEGPASAIYNVGTGSNTTVLEVARLVDEELGTNLQAEVAQRYRAGDIRHCHADATRIGEGLGFVAQISREEGFAELARWSRAQAPSDQFERSLAELRSRSLVD